MGSMLSDLKDQSKKILANYLYPKHVYIPLASGGDEDITTFVKKGDYVCIGTIIGKRKEPNKISIHSSVSGYVVGFVEKYDYHGKKVRCVKIENDGKDTYLEDLPCQKKINQYTKKEFLETILDTGIVGLGGDAIPTYIKYNTDKKLTTLIVNATECDPYVSSDTVLFMEKCEEILEAIDAIVEINHMEEAVIAVSKKNTGLIHKINNYLGTYLNIRMKLVEDHYPIGWERTLVREICHTNYKEIPMEKGIVVNNVATIFAIYEALKYHKPLTERIVTFSGEGFQKQYNVKIKIGTLVKDVVEAMQGYSEENVVLVAGGAMRGKAIASDELVLSPEISCVLALIPTEVKQPLPCISCGKCIMRCPAKLNPILIKDAYQKKNKKLLEQLEVERCMGCGLCSYICPTHQNLREDMIEIKKWWKGGKS